MAYNVQEDADKGNHMEQDEIVKQFSFLELQF
jgi:hypothetical protein